jgi:photosystem II stability/assembly factor-like uncharacterized protein
MELLMIKRMNCLFLIIILIGSGFPTPTVAQVSQNNDSPGASSAGVGVAPVPAKNEGIDLITSRIPAEPYDRMWQMTGPFGGDVTAMAIDPRNADRIWLGTSDGQIFRSTDGGTVWRRIRPGIITVILFDSEKAGIIYAGLKPLLDLTEEANGGGVFISEDDGQTWNMLEGMRGRSVRNMAQSTKDHNVLVAAARDGIYRTGDRGQTWERITPANDPELKGFHSVAIDPRDANVIYVGTHHLPWKTTDAGKTWKLAASKEKGMIDDSDIFAIHIDASDPDTVLMSACSGIYRSRNASETWTKIQGIPYTSRRTHVIYQHPTKPEMIFAGTTEGLWLSTNHGKPDSWRRMTSLRMVINSIAIHPDRPDRVLLGTDDNGVLISVDGGEGYDPSNAGFINRQVRAVVADKAQPGRVYAGVIFDRVNGGLFISEDGGVTWNQSMSGMGVRDVYSIYQSDSDPATIYAGTNHGLFRSDDRGGAWRQVKKEEKEDKEQKDKKEEKLEQKAEQSASPTGAATDSATAEPENDPVNLAVPISSPPKAAKPRSAMPVSARTKSANKKADRGKAARASGLKSKKGKLRPSETAKSSRSSRQTRSTRPNESAKAAKTSKTTGTTGTTARTRSTKPDESARSAKQTRPGRATRTDKPVKPTKPVKPEGEILVDLQNQVFAILPFTPFIATAGNNAGSGAGDSQSSSTQSDQASQSSQSSWMIASTWNGLFITEDEKKGWREIKFPKAGDRAGGSVDSATRIKINVVATNPNAPGAIFIGTDDGLFVSRDNGESFKQMRLDEEARRIRSIAFDPRTAETIYVGTATGFFRSLDGGHTWENRGGGMPLVTDVAAITISAAKPNELYLSDESRGVLFHSKDCGTNWVKVDISQLPSLKLWSLVGDPFDANKIYAGSFSGGVYVMSRK